MGTLFNKLIVDQVDSSGKHRLNDMQKIARNARHPGIALVFQGGGARAAYQVGVLKAVSEILGHPEENPFPIITETSSGAINAAVLAVNADNFARGVVTLFKVWENFSPEKVYRTDFSGVARNSVKWLAAFLFGAVSKNHKVSLFDNAPLIDLIERYVPVNRIAKHIELGVLRAVSVTASGYTSGQNCAAALRWPVTCCSIIVIARRSSRWAMKTP